MHTSAPIAWLLACLTIVLSVSARADEIDGFVQAEARALQIPGLAIAVVRNGEVVKAQGYGVANIEWNAATTPETVFQAGSVGKQFTATLVMMLVEEGKIGLDDPISKYIAGVPKSWKGITVRHLLTHTSGISSRSYDSKLNPRQDYSEDELLKLISSSPLEFRPGEQWGYSNPGYVMLGILIRKVTGRFYGDLLRERIFTPLGMSTARVISEAGIVPHRAAGYRLLDGELKNQEWVSPSLNTTADGSLYMTVLDLARWDAALYTGELLEPSSLELMWTPVKLKDGKTAPYGFGWALGEIRGHRIIEHGGAWQGFRAHIARYVDDKLTVIVMANLGTANTGRIAHGIAGLYNAELAPIQRKAIELDPAVFDAYAGEYELEPGFVLKFFREGNRFWVQATGQPRLEVFAESETRFFVREAEAQTTFVKDASGQVTHLIFHGRVDREARRLKRPRP